jgi:formate hydrogenlyase subunit 3/multisubunit Na+/H+ antiporter MnhD subunit
VIPDLMTLIPLAIVVPLIAAMLAFLLPRAAWAIALGAALLTAAIVLGMAVLLPEAGVTRHAVGGWMAPLGIDLVLDGLSLLMLLLTAVLGVAITIYARGYFDPAHNDGDAHQFQFFYPLWLFLWTSLNALFLSGDVFNLYVTLELLGFSAVALTALAGKPAVLKAAMRYLTVTLSGSLIYLLGVAFLYGQYGTLDIALLAARTTGSPALAVAAALITTGLVMKTALFPMHFWLPPAHANAAAPVSALLSALVVKGSFYILLRVWLEVMHPLAGTLAPHILSVLGGAAIVWGSLQAIRQQRLKLLVAYSTVAQLGYLFVLLPQALIYRDDTALLAGIVGFAIAHAVAKSAAFLSAGSILHATGSDEMARFPGLMQAMPLTIATFALAGISLIALPPSGGFIAKWLMLNSALDYGYWLTAIVILAGGVLAAGYIMRGIAPVFRKPAGEYDPHHHAGHDIEHEPEPTDDAPLHVHPVPRTMTWTAFALAVLAILLTFSGTYILETLTIAYPAIAGGGL